MIIIIMFLNIEMSSFDGLKLANLDPLPLFTKPLWSLPTGGNGSHPVINLMIRTKMDGQK